MLKTANNAKVVQALVVMARAHAAIPGFELRRSINLTNRLELCIGEESRMHAVYALVMLLLKGIGAFDDGDIRRLSES